MRRACHHYGRNAPPALGPQIARSRHWGNPPGRRDHRKSSRPLPGSPKSIHRAFHQSIKPGLHHVHDLKSLVLDTEATPGAHTPAKSIWGAGDASGSRPTSIQGPRIPYIEHSIIMPNFSSSLDAGGKPSTMVSAGESRKAHHASQTITCIEHVIITAEMCHQQ